VLSLALNSDSSFGNSSCVMLESSWPMKAPMHTVPTTSQRYDARPAMLGAGGGSRALKKASRIAAADPGTEIGEFMDGVDSMCSPPEHSPYRCAQYRAAWMVVTDR
jgi:hypothetical protein